MLVADEKGSDRAVNTQASDVSGADIQAEDRKSLLQVGVVQLQRDIAAHKSSFVSLRV